MGTMECSRRHTSTGNGSSEVSFLSQQREGDTGNNNSNKQVMDTSKIARYLWLGQKDTHWYQDCEDTFVKLFGRDRLWLVANLFAATSINTSLKSNITLFRKALSEIDQNAPVGNYLPNIKTSIQRIRDGKELSGRKIRSFAAAMSGDKDAVVVDIWILRAFEEYRSYKVGGKDALDMPVLPKSIGIEFEATPEDLKLFKDSVYADAPNGYTGRMRSGSATPKQYDMIEQYIRQEARSMGLQPRMFCAAIWSGVRLANTGDNTSHYKELLIHSLTNLFNVI